MLSLTTNHRLLFVLYLNLMETQELPSLTDLAQVALSLGFVPIPIVGKRPILPRWQQTTAQTAMRKVEDAVRTGSADNLGILTGAPSGIVVVDVDVAKGGLDFWNELVAEHGIPETFTVETGNGGRHYYFQYDDRTSTLRNATGAIKKKGIDLKTTGGQVVWVGSIHPETGRMYDIIDGTDEQGNVTIAPMPDWLFNLLQANQTELDKKYPRKYGRV